MSTLNGPLVTCALTFAQMVLKPIFRKPNTLTSIVSLSMRENMYYWRGGRGGCAGYPGQGGTLL